MWQEPGVAGEGLAMSRQQVAERDEASSSGNQLAGGPGRKVCVVGASQPWRPCHPGNTAQPFEVYGGTGPNRYRKSCTWLAFAFLF